MNNESNIKISKELEKLPSLVDTSDMSKYQNNYID